MKYVCELPLVVLMAAGRATTYYLRQLDHRPSLDALYKRFHMEWLQRKISRAKREAPIYEAGSSESLTPGLIAFKDRWSTKYSTLTTWWNDGGLTSASRTLKVRRAKEVFSLAPNSVLTMAGGILYRHIG